MYFRASKLLFVAAAVATAVSAAPLDLSGTLSGVTGLVGGVVNTVTGTVTGLVDGVVLPLVVDALNEVRTTADAALAAVPMIVNDVLQGKTLDVVNQLLASGGVVDDLLDTVNKEITTLDTNVLSLKWLTGTATDVDDVLKQVTSSLGTDLSGITNQVFGLSLVNGVFAFALGTVKDVTSAVGV
ncbi:hypothetical protein LPJ59_003068 [Coemansia sp. RSA 2399]|nr:hypothetical protein LPJ59_003068 [Coemansia sp. RSA 2399]KAJ1904622.1 hypothetical protein LPJ81_002390 [Coemansia sp. IMI 209127]